MEEEPAFLCVGVSPPSRVSSVCCSSESSDQLVCPHRRLTAPWHRAGPPPHWQRLFTTNPVLLLLILKTFLCGAAVPLHSDPTPTPLTATYLKHHGQDRFRAMRAQQPVIDGNVSRGWFVLQSNCQMMQRSKLFSDIYSQAGVPTLHI